jgi:2-keto-3-deoxy-L-rhamnonate aldolase RhmA
MTGQLPLFSLQPTPTQRIVDETNAHASSVILMIETADSVANVEDIASVDGVDVLLIGSNDLAIELQVPGQFTSTEFRSALEKVSAACRKFGKTFGLAGIYDAPDIQRWALQELGAGFMLVQQDSGLLSAAGKKAADAVSMLMDKQP